MAQNLPDSAELRQLQKAFAQGDVYLVNEDARPVTFEESLDAHCWAHLKDAADGQVYVQELWHGSRELLKPRYLDLLGANV
jgi:hypothetical protein